jgi:uncharacterized membrane protein YcaP (DUF421 family)
MLLFIGKAILLYMLTIIAIRFMGKSTFAQLTAHDVTGIFFVVTLAIGPLVTKNMAYAIVGLIAVSVIHIIFTKLTLINRLNKVFVGQPTIVIKHGKLIKANLKRSRITLAGLLSSMREKGYPDVDFIDYALIEPSGQISILPKQEAAPVTPKQLQVETSYQGIPTAVIIEGEIQHGNLQLIGKDEQWLKKELDVAGFPDKRNIFYAAVRDNDHSLTIDSGTGDFRQN